MLFSCKLRRPENDKSEAAGDLSGVENIYAGYAFSRFYRIIVALARIPPHCYVKYRGIAAYVFSEKTQIILFRSSVRHNNIVRCFHIIKKIVGAYFHAVKKLTVPCPDNVGKDSDRIFPDKLRRQVTDAVGGYQYVRLFPFFTHLCPPAKIVPELCAYFSWIPALKGIRQSPY